MILAADARPGNGLKVTLCWRTNQPCTNANTPAADESAGPL